VRPPDNYSPLPWREGIKGRGKLASTPTLALPHQGGGGFEVVGQPIVRLWIPATHPFHFHSPTFLVLTMELRVFLLYESFLAGMGMPPKVILLVSL